MRVLILPLLLLAPLLTGCLGDDADAPAPATPAAKTAADAGATGGPAPSAPKEAYAVAPDPEAKDQLVTAYPATVKTNPAKPPVTVDLSGKFSPGDCRGLNFGTIEPVLAAASVPRRVHDLSEHLAVGDVFQYEIALSFQNKDTSWGEIQAYYGIGSTVRATEEPTHAERGPVVVNWTGQGYRASEDDLAFVAVSCFVGLVTEPIPYTLTVKLTFADAAVPAEAPMRVPVPEGATRMFVRGVPLDPAKGVMSHFRLFHEDDTLLCECALSSAQEVATVEVQGGTELVLLVDHTDNGFVGVAFDAPGAEPLEALTTEWVIVPVVAGDGGPVDQTVEVDLPKVPLFLHAAVMGPEDGTPGGGRKTSIDLTNGRGQPLRVAWGGHVAMRLDDQGRQAWLGFWPGDWDYAVDHHAFAPGKHVAQVKADALRGEVVLLTRQYVR